MYLLKFIEPCRVRQILNPLEVGPVPHPAGLMYRKMVGEEGQWDGLPFCTGGRLPHLLLELA